MKTDTAQKIVDYIKKNRTARVHDLVSELNITNVAIHRQLKKLIESDIVSKAGTPPLVFYKISNKRVISNTLDQLDSRIRQLIENEYLYISPIGEELYGIEGFIEWAQRTNQNQNMPKLALEYASTLTESRSFFNNQDWIDATKKVQATFPERYIDHLFYAEFYSLPKFGKTKLGQLMLYAKQSQNRDLIRQLADKTYAIINKIISEHNIDLIGFIPPTIPRKVQFQKEYERFLHLQLPTLDLRKVFTGNILVAQKTLSSADERIQNAKETIEVSNSNVIGINILLIDDAVGSGATLNETAKKLKSSGIAKESVIGFAIVGSYKGFEVIREV